MAGCCPHFHPQLKAVGRTAEAEGTTLLLVVQARSDEQPRSVLVHFCHAMNTASDASYGIRG